MKKYLCVHMSTCVLAVEKCQKNHTKKLGKNIGRHLKKKKKEHQQCSNVYTFFTSLLKEITALWILEKWWEAVLCPGLWYICRYSGSLEKNGCRTIFSSYVGHKYPLDFFWLSTTMTPPWWFSAEPSQHRYSTNIDLPTYLNGLIHSRTLVDWIDPFK